MQTLFLTLGLLAIAVLGLALTILLKKNGKFPDTHVGHNKELRKKGITCAKGENMGCSPINGSSACESCYSKEEQD